jgi:hypothetical protein
MITYRFHCVSLPRAATKARDDILWELGLAGWELVCVLPGSEADASDGTMLTFFFKREATTDIA